MSAEPSPSVSARMYQGWMQIAARFGEVQTLIVLTLVYTFVIGPFALGSTAIEGISSTSAAWACPIRPGAMRIPS